MQRKHAPDLQDVLRPQARGLKESGIVRAMNYGRGKPGLIPLWTGEGDVPTPAFLGDAAHRSMLAGETFYTYQRGIPELRAAISDYYRRLRGLDIPSDRIFVTGSGMQAIQIAVQAIAGIGDEVVIPTPAWPNCAAALELLGATVVPIPFDFAADGWRLQLDRVMAACGARTRAIYINSPANPTGWVMSGEERGALLSFARERGLWIIADDVYERFNYASDGPAPSFIDIAAPEDRLLVINTFSKNWSMTGWRMGWLLAPAALGQLIENLIQYNTSGVAVFMQRAGIEAIEKGEAFATEQVARARAGRDVVCEQLGRSNRIRFAKPDGAFYLLFAIDGHEDTDALALRLIDEAGIGLAPGTAFGRGGKRFMRLCFARSPDSLSQAAERLLRWVESN